jgi:putative cardiolipin synthase
LFSLRPNRDGGGSQAPKFRAGESAENLAETCDRFWTANCPGGRFSSMIHGVRFVARRSLIALCSLQIAASVTRAGTPVESPLAPFVAETRRELLPSGTAPEDRLAMIGNGYDALLLRVHLIRQATASIAIQTFIWTNDECGRLLIYELIEAARRGVNVRLIVDHMFSDQDADIVAFLATVHPNFAVRHYRPAMSRMKPSLYHTLLAGIRSFRDTNQRMHNKVMVVDGAILLTGGRNVENTYFDHATGLNFRDRDVLAIGAVARAALESFESYWHYRHSVPSGELVDVQAAIAGNRFRRYPTRNDYDFGPHFSELDREASDAALIASRFVPRLKPVQKVSFVADEPGKTLRSSVQIARITRELRHVLEKATTSVVMQTPYLVLSRPARNLFREMQVKNPGLQVRISTNSFASTDNLMAYSANYRLRNEYVQDLKLAIYEFKPQPATLERLFPRHRLLREIGRADPARAGMRPPFLCMHAKSLVVDDRIAFIGSYNLDPRSEHFNTEAGLLIEDPTLPAN